MIAVLATPQTTISLVIGAAPTDGSSDDDSLPAGLVAEGEVLGTGPDGTTYAISLAQTYSGKILGKSGSAVLTIFCGFRWYCYLNYSCRN